MSNYAKADTKVQWVQDKYPGSDMNLSPATMVLGLHTTEGTGWDDYKGGADAPTYTAHPNIKAKALSWRGHFPDEKSARALVNAAGGVDTNTMNVVQVELVGTCDVAHAKTWGNLKAGIDYIYWPDAPDWLLAELADFVADMHRRHGLALTARPVWLAYGPDPRRKDGKSPAAYGDNGVRMTFAEWHKFTGICGHQHVPENVHGDPGNFPIDRLLAMVHAIVDPKSENKKQPVAKKPAKKAPGRPVAPATLRIGFANMNWGTGQKADENIVADLIHQGCNLLGLVEAKVDNLRTMDLPAGWHVAQSLENAAKQGSAAAWDKTVTVTEIRPLRVGVLPGAAKMLARYLRIIDVQLDGKGFRFIVCHRPPSRFKRLWMAFDKSVKTHITATKDGRDGRWAVVADCNEPITKWAKTIGGTAHGEGIVGAVLGHGLRGSNDKVDHSIVARRLTDHPGVIVDVTVA